MKSLINLSFSVNDIRSDEYKILQENACKNDRERLYKRLSEFVIVCCPACGDQKTKLRFEKFKCKFLVCEVCETLFMSPRPTQEIMTEYYTHSENYEIWNKFIFPKSEKNRKNNICIPNLNQLVKVCRRLNINKPSFLEIGSGFGTFALLAKDSGFFNNVSVIERTPSMAIACREKGLHVIESAFEDLDFESVESVDIVSCFEVLEHIFDPLQFIAKINRILKANGLFYFTCPNGKGFDTEMLQSASPSVDNEHVNLFNIDSIEILLNRAGFEVISSETPGRLDFELVQRAVIAKEVDLAKTPFWGSLFLERHKLIGENFQKFLVDNKLSGSMRVIARKL
jgi:SAM-dependent methyltransferase